MANKTSILFVVPGFGLGGSSTALASILNSSFSKEYDIDVYAVSRRNIQFPPLTDYDIGLNSLTTAYHSDFSQISLKDKIRFFYVKLLKQIPTFSKKLEIWVAKRTIKMIEKKKKYDYVVAFQEGVATRFTSHFTCEKKIAWIHCDYAFAYGKSRNELDLYKKFSKIVCVSKFTKNEFAKLYPAIGDKIIAIYNLFDAESVFRKAEEPLTDSNFDTSQFTILSVGRVCDVKQFFLIPQIAQQLVYQKLNFKWYVLGKADDTKELYKLMESIKQYDMQDYIFYLGGKANPYPYFKKADLLVSLSKSEACPMIFNEAKILHLPILSSDFGSAFEFIEQGKNGYISSIERMSQMVLDMAKGEITTNRYQNNNYISDWNEEILSQLKLLFSK